MTKIKNNKKANAVKAAALMLVRASKSTKQKQNKKKKSRASGTKMGPVSTISTAPVAMGNSVRGSSTAVRSTPTGCIATGRDFMFTPIGTGSITTWTMVGGTPLSPVAFGDSSIRQYMQMYQKYRWRKCNVYYITSSPTSATGDVMFYYGKNRDSVFLNQTSSFLLPFVISDPSTVIGPQWTNHAAALDITGTWKSTDYGMEASLQDYADGEVFLLSKTTTTDSPGYILFDYVVEFAELQISPRLLNLPLPRAQYNNVALTAGGAKVQGNTAGFTVTAGTNLSGATSTAPTGYTGGDIYKIIFDNTNSTYTIGSSLNLLQIVWGTSTNVLTITDGLTLYAVATDVNNMALYPNADCAYAGSNPLQWGASLTFNVNVQVWISLIGTLSNVNLKPNY